jgi:hypothetical protein
VSLRKPGTIEILLHREPRTQQSYPSYAVLAYARGRRVGDVNERDLNRLLYRRCNLVHGIGAKEKEIGAALLEPQCVSRENSPGRGPVTGVLQALDTLEVDAVHEYTGRVLPAETPPYLLVDDPVVLGR